MVRVLVDNAKPGPRKLRQKPVAAKLAAKTLDIDRHQPTEGERKSR